jgi:hypothetical protein
VYRVGELKGIEQLAFDPCLNQAQPLTGVVYRPLLPPAQHLIVADEAAHNGRSLLKETFAETEAQKQVLTPSYV